MEEKYLKHAQPPEWALKKIEGGRLKNMTDINPQWRIYALTDLYGMCGTGWTYSVEKIDYKDGSDGTVAVIAFVNLHLCIDGKWTNPIVGVGGSMFISKEKESLYTNDESVKMAITDALSVCCKLLGIGSNIYSGSKYSLFQANEELLDSLDKAQSLEELKDLWNNNKNLVANDSILQAKFTNKKNKLGGK